MTTEVLQTTEKDPRRKNVAFDFTKKALEKTPDKTPTKKKDLKKPAPAKVAEVSAKPIEQPKAQIPQQIPATKQLKTEQHHYRTLSTQQYKTVHRALKKLAQEREDTAHKTKTIKAFITEALEYFFEKNPSLASPMPTRENDILVTFNNQIRSDLRTKLKKLSNQRDTAEVPRHTIIDILDEAFTHWLPLQPEVAAGIVPFEGTNETTSSEPLSEEVERS